MICPKCGGKMHDYAGASVTSATNQQDGATATFIAGYTCIMCGKWIDNQLIVVKPKPALSDRERTSAGKKMYVVSLADRLVWEFRDSIASMLKKGDSVATIFKMLRFAKPEIRISERGCGKSITRLQSGALALNLEGK